MRTAIEREEMIDFGYSCAIAGMDRYAARTLPRIAKRLHSLYERACCVPVDEEQHERSVERWQKRAEAICKGAGVEIEHQTDPRGWPIILRARGREWRVPPFNVGETGTVYEDFQKVTAESEGR